MARAVFFDVDGVLVHGYHAKPELQQRWDENLLEDLGIRPEDFKTEFIYGTFINEVLPGKLSLVAALDDVLPRLGYKGSSLTLVDYWLRHDSNIDVAMFETVKKLARQPGVDLYMATNQDHLRAFYIWQELGYGDLFKDMFYASRMGVSKPDAAFFDRVMERIGPQDTPPLFFDDSPKVIEAANAYGWEAVLYETHKDCIGHPFITERLS
ncbi:HAD-IA family hydrolase [Pelagibacterium halotolerans]|uniref:HAD-IA family hydrolase n=1 Tax=Pelagibacterium halotolerans TaxID=531813 RepID=UPI00384F3C7A